MVERMNRRVDDLSAHFATHLKTFNESRLFTGPSLHFHQKALRARLQHGSVWQLLSDDGFFDAVYATLTAWGMHRMGPGKTKLRDLSEIKVSLQTHAAQIESLSGHAITAVAADEPPMPSGI